PAQPPASLFSTWIVADVSRGLIYYLGAWGFAGYLLLGALMVLLPLFDRTPERRLRNRPIVGSIGVIFFLGFLVAWGAGHHLRARPISASGELAPYVQPIAQPGPALPSIRPTPMGRPAPAPARPDTSRPGGTR
ncbi:MAG: hypothetical protein B7Z72_15225, partial [Gemmatimonadetes bacterium 21-71-4]